MADPRITLVLSASEAIRLERILLDRVRPGLFGLSDPDVVAERLLERLRDAAQTAVPAKGGRSRE